MSAPCPHRRRHAVLVLVLSSVLATVLLWVTLALPDKRSIPGLDAHGSPNRDYLHGFECGVRWGLVAQILEPDANGHELTKIAKFLHWHEVIGKNRPQAMDCSEHIETTRHEGTP